MSGAGHGREGAAATEAANLIEPSRPLRVAVLVKQVPVADAFELGPDGRLRREGTPLEMNPYCRRAVSKGTELAEVSGGTCTVFTLGPPEAEDVLREALAWGADAGVHVCDPAFAGSDTLATARALAAALAREGPFDLVLVGRSSVDGETGQIGPEIAELADLPIATGVRRLALSGDVMRLQLEHDDVAEEVEIALPALLSVAERLCDPCKVDPDGRQAVPADRIRRLGPSDLGGGPWGDAASPTRVGAVRAIDHVRRQTVLVGDVATQVKEAVQILDSRGALTAGLGHGDGGAELAEAAARSLASAMALPDPALRAAGGGNGHRPVVGVVLEQGRPKVGAELLGAASRLAGEVGGEVVAITSPGAGTAADPSGPPDPDDPVARPGPEELGTLGADEVVELEGEAVAEDVADALVEWIAERRPWVVMAPSTAFGREVAGRAAAATGSGLIGDAIALDVVDGRFVAAKPAFSGALVADITCTSPVEMVTVRPGVLPVPRPRVHTARVVHRPLGRRGRVRILSRHRDDDLEVLARAEVVIGVGAAVHPDEYPRLSALAALLGAELAATRKVTDKGWAPRARQVGITGRSIAPRLYVAIGLSGKFNHMVGVRSSGTVLAVNTDPGAPVFSHADVGLVADWHEVLPLLEAALRERH
jgi:electron transfer flavoprotein alpha subunit